MKQELEMKINEVTTAIKLGVVDYNDKTYNGPKHVAYDRKISINWDSSLSSEMKTRYLGWVYIIVVDGEIYKIGQSSAKNGISGTLAFYMSAGFDNPGQNRFIINLLIRRSLDEGKVVEFYGLYQEPVVVETTGLFSTHKTEMISAKGLETACISDYLSVEETHPVWNFQEAGVPVPRDLEAEFVKYRSLRVG